MKDLLSREVTKSNVVWNRWAAVLAALAIGGSLGQVYSLSVTKIPLTKLLGTPADWTQSELGWVFSIAIGFLGASSALFGSWVDKAGPRRAMFTSALLWSMAFFISGIAINIHSLGLLYFGYGVVGGIGLGIGYLSPISTLVRWFPRNPGLGTGLAISGFGGGASIGAPLFVELHKTYSVGATYEIMGTLYFTVMMLGCLVVRIPGQIESLAPTRGNKPISKRYVPLRKAVQTWQLACFFLVLACNVTAGIGFLEQASPFIQEVYLIPRGYSDIEAAAAAAGFVGLLSLSNQISRVFWSAISDYIGRKTVYSIFFTVGISVFLLMSFAGAATGSFVICLGALILMCYGGGFSTLPAYMKDQYGSGQIGAIYGIVLLAWSLAGIVGPVLTNYFRDAAIKAGHTGFDRYTTSFEIFAGILLVGAIANLMVAPISKENFVEEKD